MTQPRILIVAKDSLAQTGLVTLLKEMTTCEIAGRSSGGAKLPDDIDYYAPDVILYDLGWNPGAVVPYLENLVDDDPPIIALIPGEDDARAVNAALVATGVYGLLLRDSEPDVLAAAINSVVNGLMVIDPLIAPTIIRTDSPEVTLVEALTPRENDVLQLLAQGLTNKAIAYQLKITEHTVKFHVTAIMGKLDAQSRTDAVVRATQLGLIIL